MKTLSYILLFLCLLIVPLQQACADDTPSPAYNFGDVEVPIEIEGSTLLRTDGAASLLGSVELDWFYFKTSFYTDHLVDHGQMGWMVYGGALPYFGDSKFYGGARASLAQLGAHSDLMWDIGGRIGISNLVDLSDNKEPYSPGIVYMYFDISMYEDNEVHGLAVGGFNVGNREVRIGLEMTLELYEQNSLDVWVGYRGWDYENERPAGWMVRIGAIKDPVRAWWGRGAPGRTEHGWSGFILFSVSLS